MSSVAQEVSPVVTNIMISTKLPLQGKESGREGRGVMSPRGQAGRTETLGFQEQRANLEKNAQGPQTGCGLHEYRTRTVTSARPPGPPAGMRSGLWAMRPEERRDLVRLSRSNRSSKGGGREDSGLRAVVLVEPGFRPRLDTH